MSGALCLKCGDWKQAPTARCGCGFIPVKGTIDIAKSYICTEQFRSSEELEEIAKLIRSGTPISCDEQELSVAATIGTWNMMVNLGTVFAVALGSLLVVGLIAGLPIKANVILGLAFGAALVFVYALMKTVDHKVEQARLTLGRMDGL